MIFESKRNTISSFQVKENPEKPRSTPLTKYQEESFKKLGLLGIGRYSKVYKCVFKKIGFIFALKEIEKSTINISSLEASVHK